MEKLYVDYNKYASDVSPIENSRGTGAEAQRWMIGKMSMRKISPREEFD